MSIKASVHIIAIDGVEITIPCGSLLYILLYMLNVVRIDNEGRMGDEEKEVN